MYSYDLPINALKLLKEGEHTDVIDYIKKYDLDGWFMYGRERNLYLQVMNDKMNKLLDDDGSHSGDSWGFMMRLVQAVLVGTYTMQDLILAREMQEERHQKIMMARANANANEVGVAGANANEVGGAGAGARANAAAGAGAAAAAAGAAAASN